MKWIQQEQEVTVFKFGKGLVKEKKMINVEVEDRDERFTWIYTWIDKHSDENHDLAVDKMSYMNFLDDYAIKIAIDGKSG